MFCRLRAQHICAHIIKCVCFVSTSTLSPAELPLGNFPSWSPHFIVIQIMWVGLSFCVGYVSWYLATQHNGRAKNAQTTLPDSLQLKMDETVPKKKKFSSKLHSTCLTSDRLINLFHFYTESVNSLERTETFPIKKIYLLWPMNSRLVRSPLTFTSLYLFNESMV